jgi:hypothetical protein
MVDSFELSSTGAIRGSSVRLKTQAVAIAIPTVKVITAVRMRTVSLVIVRTSEVVSLAVERNATPFLATHPNFLLRNFQTREISFGIRTIPKRNLPLTLTQF